MKADLLVLNYNTKDKLKRLLDTLMSDYEPGVWDLYVADNDSQDGSFEWLSQVQEEYHIKVLFKNPNVGFSAAMGPMANVSRNEIITLVNADTWFTTSHVKQALQTFIDNPNQTAMGPKQRDENSVIRHGGIFWDGDKSVAPVHRGWNVPDPADTMFRDRIQCWTVSGSIYYVRRDVWDEMTKHPSYRSLFPREHGCTLGTFLYFDETFVSVFLQALGYEVWYDGTIETAGHSWHASNKPGDNVHHFHDSKELYRRTCDILGINHEIN